jgi:hypothetical protein
MVIGSTVTPESGSDATADPQDEALKARAEWERRLDKVSSAIQAVVEERRQALGEQWVISAPALSRYPNGDVVELTAYCIDEDAYNAVVAELPDAHEARLLLSDDGIRPDPEYTRKFNTQRISLEAHLEEALRDSFHDVESPPGILLRDCLLTNTRPPEHRLLPLSNSPDLPPNPVALVLGEPEDVVAADGTTIKAYPIRSVGGEAYKLVFPDGSAGVYKPDGEGGSIGDDFLRARAWGREVGAYDFDRMAGFGLVPETVVHHGHRGLGSLQRWVDNTQDGMPPDSYAPQDQERMAVIDYVIGNGDRSRPNYLTDPDGRPVAIDHELTFPVGSNYGICSSFVITCYGRQLSDEVLNQVRAVDPKEFENALYRAGRSTRAVGGALARLREVQQTGAITGRAWDGEITDGNLNVWKRANPGGPDA